MNIDISTEEKRKQVYELFNSFNKIGDIYAYYKTSDNKSNVDYVKYIANQIGFDLSSYKRRNKKYCLNCNKELKSSQTKFCSSSCAASYNNKLRGPRTEETKNKIREAIKLRYPDKKQKSDSSVKTKKQKLPTLLECVVCGKMFKRGKSSLRTCSEECLHILQQRIGEEKSRANYKYFLENPEEFCRPNYTPKFKKFFLEEQEYKCAVCGCENKWNGKPLVFVLDHIDGDASNNRRENLRLVCPNCDSQLDTFKSKNKNSTRRNYWKEKIIRELS
jgi:predicted nucleic acid-binding Zn ribbon protein